MKQLNLMSFDVTITHSTRGHAFMLVILIRGLWFLSWQGIFGQEFLSKESVDFAVYHDHYALVDDSAETVPPAVKGVGNGGTQHVVQIHMGDLKKEGHQL